MNSTTGGLHFEATMSNDDMKRKLAEIRQGLLNSGKAAEEQGSKIEGMFKRAALAAGAFFTAQQAISLSQNIIRVRGEIQMMEKSFEVLLGSKAKANKMIAEIKQLAIDSPLEMPQVSGAVQTLLGYGIAADKVMKIVGQLSDVSKGNADQFRSLSLAYAQVQSTGKLMGQDLLQMINAGFNPLKTISEQTGKSIGQLKKEMSDGAISAEMVASAFDKVTSAGGMFYQMTQKQAEGIVGVQATFEDAITNQMNKFGEKNEELIVGGYKFATSVVENADVIGKALGVLVVAYGSYRAAIIAVSVTEKIVASSQNISAWFELAKGIKTSKDAMTALNLAMGANPILKIVSLLIAAGTALYLFVSNSNDAEKELTGLAKATKSAGEEFDKEVAKIDALRYTIEKSALSYDRKKLAIAELQKIIPNYNAELNKEGEMIRSNTSAIEDYLKALDRQIKLKIIEEERVEASKTQRQAQKTYDAAKKENDKKLYNSAYGKNNDAIIDVASWFGLKDEQKTQEALKEATEKLNDANSSVNELNTEIEKIEASIDSSTTTVKTFSEQLADAAGNVSKYKKELADLKSGKGDGVADFAKSIEDKEKELKEAQSKYDLLASIDRKGGGKSNKDYTEQLAKDAWERQLAIEQASINAMDEGADKKLAQLDFNHKRELEKLQQQKQQMLAMAAQVGDENAAKQINSDFVMLEQGASDKYQQERFEISKQELKSLQDAIMQGLDAEYNAELDYLSKYGDLQNQKIAIALQYADKIENAKTQGEKMSLEKQKQQSLKEVDIAQIQQSAPFNTLFDNLDNSSTSTISKAIAAARGLLESASQSGKYSADDLKVLYDALDKAETEVRTRNPFKALTEAFKNWNKTDPKKSFASLATAASDSFGLIGSSMSTVVGGLKEMGMAGDESTQQILDDSIKLVSSFGDIAQGLATMNPAKILQGVMGAVTALFAIFDGRTRRANSVIKAEQENIEKLKVQYKDLELTIAKALGVDYYKKQTDSARLLTAQVSSLNKQIAAEKSKKRRKQNQGQVDEWEQQKKELLQQAADIKQGIIDELSTTDLKSYTSDLTSSLIDGLSNGLDNADQVIQDKMDTLLKNMIAKQFDMLVAQKAMKPMFDSMAAGFDEGSDGGFALTEAEMADVIDKGNQGKEVIKRSLGSLEQMMANLGLINQDVNNDLENAKALSGQIQRTMTEQTATEFGGIWRGQWDTAKRIEMSVDLGFKNVAEMARTNLIIATNTGRTADNTTGLREELQGVRKELETIIKNTQKENGTI